METQRAQFTVYVDKWLFDALKASAEWEGRSLAGYVRQILESSDKVIDDIERRELRAG